MGIHRAGPVGLRVVAFVLALASSASGQQAPPPPAPVASTHPYFNDRGALSWSTSLEDAQEAARKSGKLILVEFGRKACGNCRAFVERVVPDARIRERLGAIAVGFAAECDPPGRRPDVAALLSEHIPNAKTLPWVGLVTADLEWVAGFSGRREAGLFILELAAAEKSPLRPAKAEVRAKLALILTLAQAAAAKGDWKGVIAAAHAADATTGRCDERAAIDEIRAHAAAWAEERLAGLAASLRAGSADMADLKTRLTSIAHDFAGEPAGADAKKGLDALARHATYVFARDAGETAKVAALREKALAEFKGTRWEALFRV
jgi:hypothetical protein